jgi:hypothetical protein
MDMIFDMTAAAGEPYKAPVLNPDYPADGTIDYKGIITLQVIVDTPGNPTVYAYQWYVDGIAVEGATGASYAYTPGKIGTSTLYCQVTNAAGTVTSRTAVITADYLYLYKEGTFLVPFVKTDTANNGYAQGVNAGTSKGSVSFLEGEIRLYCYEKSGGNNSIQFLGTTDPVDMSQYKTLKVAFRSAHVGYSSSSNNWIMVSATPSKAFPGNGSGASYYKLNWSHNGAATLSVDVQSQSSAYVVITGHEYSADDIIEAYITGIWLE